ncbi:MlaD family protein [Hoyosella subflava]|uniref:Putative Mce family protein n=1 Tax=Hoyosella subflava (strain DSM 45089 / JCM 17490 / NBRC 109087 / DQS3-9A1) TaxID=443218 RepID=F6ERP0_HOYSD|nr:MlaD family protein [Hoyosella subflava]AEF39617.1 Putative Mce family protein [Hoyosella subflava DQS3-9A1]
MKTFLDSRGFMSVVGLLVLCAAIIAGYVVAFNPGKKVTSYCAMMPDTIGLYVGNDVTMLGIRVGKVTQIDPHGESVRVDFDIDAEHALRGEVSATTVSNTLVADRHLAVLSNGEQSEWDPGECITRTLTPKSMTQTLNAIGKLADELNGGGIPLDAQRVNRGISALDGATDGTGPQISHMIARLGVALDSPEGAVDHIGSLIDVLSELSASVADGWGGIKDMLIPFPDVLEFVNGKVWLPIAGIIDSLRILIPILNDITTTYGDGALPDLDRSVPTMQLIGANVESIGDIVNMIPPIISAFESSSDPVTGATVLRYAAPNSLMNPVDDEVCEALNALVPNGCPGGAHGPPSADLLPAILGRAGER